MRNIKTFEKFFFKKKKPNIEDILTSIDECLQEIVDDGYTIKYKYVLMSPFGVMDIVNFKDINDVSVIYPNTNLFKDEGNSFIVEINREIKDGKYEFFKIEDLQENLLFIESYLKKEKGISITIKTRDLHNGFYNKEIYKKILDIPLYGGYIAEMSIRFKL